LPDDGYEEVHVKADRAMLIVRKILSTMEAEERGGSAQGIARQAAGVSAVARD
jgi:hypothetical protein